jgi:hypothetical protein
MIHIFLSLEMRNQEWLGILEMRKCRMVWTFGVESFLNGLILFNRENGFLI